MSKIKLELEDNGAELALKPGMHHGVVSSVSHVPETGEYMVRMRLAERTPAVLAVADLLDWLLAHSESRNSGTRSTFRQIASILTSHGFRVPELIDVTPLPSAPRPKPRKRGKRKQVRTQAHRDHTAEIRDWAKKQGMDVGDNGRLPVSVHQAYVREHQIGERGK